MKIIISSLLRPLAASAALAGLALAAGSVAAQGVGVSIGINQPGVYGRIDLGNYPQPALISPQPVVIEPGPVVAQRRPIYLYVPPAHQRDWRHYCGRYNACGQPVYFVQEQWVRDRYHEEHLHDRGPHGPGWERDHGRPGWDRDHHEPRRMEEHRDGRRDEHRDERPDEHRGPGPERR